MEPATLFERIKQKKSLLCVGLDSDISRIPAHLLSYDDPIYEFNKGIIEATAEFAVAYKPNLAFYEALGPKGWVTLQKTLELIPKDIFTIADAKRGDIGNTSRMYAQAFFEHFNFDSVTVAPYMGEDSVAPFLDFPGKWVFLLGLTSNPGAEDFQWYAQDKKPLYQEVVAKATQWAKKRRGNLGFVVGATRPEYLKVIRDLSPEAFFLVPGVGAQGGSLTDVMDNGMNDLAGLLVNSSRGIIYAGGGEDFVDGAHERARQMQEKMELALVERGIIA